MNPCERSPCRYPLSRSSYQFGVIEQNTPIHRVEFDPGLTDAEVAACEETFAFRFPPDLREFLQTALPRGRQFPDWRRLDEPALREWLDLPLRGVLFDIEHNGFWLDEWGARPQDLAESLNFARGLVCAAPKLIPIYGHRMMPDEPHDAGNPVFSVHQTDIIYYGFDLDDYLRHEFSLEGRKEWPKTVKAIRFRDIDRFQNVRWADGPCKFDNSSGVLS